MEGLHNPYIKTGYFDLFPIYFLAKTGGIGETVGPTPPSMIPWCDSSKSVLGSKHPLKAGNVGRHPKTKKTRVYSETFRDVLMAKPPRC